MIETLVRKANGNGIRLGHQQKVGFFPPYWYEGHFGHFRVRIVEKPVRSYKLDKERFFDALL